MSKETLQALPCPGCNIPIHFTQFHIPHCKNPNNSPFVTLAKQKGVGISKSSG